VTDLDWEQFDRYLAGEMSPAERNRFEQWLMERPERAAQMAAFRRALDGLDAEVGVTEREAIWAGILDRAEKPGSGLPAPSFALGSPARPPWRAQALLAAGVLVAAGAALAARAWLSTGREGTSAPERVVSVPRARQAQVRLPDGTAVVLGGGSTLRFPAVFASDAREVALEGDAYFSVDHDASRPFRVRAGNLVATDLGTEFLVRAYPESGQARVVVRSGTVAVRSAAAVNGAAPGPVIRPGELGRLDDHGVPVVEQADTAAYFAWTRGVLVFDGTPLREALPQLSRWYDLDFRLADSSLASIPLSGTLDRTLTGDRLELLAASLGLQQARSGRVVTLSSPKNRAR
jgi:transmembrane sensor